MSPDPTPEVFIPDQEYSHVWAQATAQTLEKLQGAPLIPAPEGPAPAAKEGAQAGESLTVLFKVSGALHGEHSFQFLRSDGVRLAQLLMGETLDPSVAFTEGHADALNEIFRQFAGLAATACNRSTARRSSSNCSRGNPANGRPSTIRFGHSVLKKSPRCNGRCCSTRNCTGALRQLIRPPLCLSPRRPQRHRRQRQRRRLRRLKLRHPLLPLLRPNLRQPLPKQDLLHRHPLLPPRQLRPKNPRSRPPPPRKRNLRHQRRLYPQSPRPLPRRQRLRRSPLCRLLLRPARRPRRPRPHPCPRLRPHRIRRIWICFLTWPWKPRCDLASEK